MKLHTSLLTLSAVSLLALPMRVDADFSCSFDLQLGVATSEQHLRVLKKGRTVVQINRTRQLFVDGRLQDLSSKQQTLLYEYAEGLHTVIPEITIITKEGVGLVTDNISRIYSGLVGEGTDTAENLNSSMSKVKKRVKEKFRHTGDYYYINPGKLEDTDAALENSLEAQIESGFSNVSGIITAIGAFDGTSDNEDTSELRKRARSSCDKLHKLNQLEETLHDNIAALRKYDIIIDRRFD